MQTIPNRKVNIISFFISKNVSFRDRSSSSISISFSFSLANKSITSDDMFSYMTPCSSRFLLFLRFTSTYSFILDFSLVHARLQDNGRAPFSAFPPVKLQLHIVCIAK